MEEEAIFPQREGEKENRWGDIPLDRRIPWDLAPEERERQRTMQAAKGLIYIGRRIAEIRDELKAEAKAQQLEYPPEQFPIFKKFRNRVAAWTQPFVSVLLGHSQAAQSAIERGEYRVVAITLFQMALEMERHIAEFFPLQDVDMPHPELVNAMLLALKTDPSMERLLQDALRLPPDWRESAADGVHGLLLVYQENNSTDEDTED